VSGVIHNDEEDKMSTPLEALTFMFSQVKQIIRKLLTFIFVHCILIGSFPQTIARSHGYDGVIAKLMLESIGGLHERERPRQGPVQSR
jgi:hypothetical protein